MGVEIYGLYDPDTDELRYIGKANNAAKRLKTHVLERKLNRPINRWVNKLVVQGKCPVMRVLEIAQSNEWETAERRLIAFYRLTTNLLNVADGGAMPSQTKEQRQNAARAAHKASIANPAMARLHKANKDVARLHARFMSSGDYSHAYPIRFMMKCWAAYAPERHQTWLAL